MLFVAMGVVAVVATMVQLPTGTGMLDSTIVSPFGFNGRMTLLVKVFHSCSPVMVCAWT
jgi:hypothetical protein